MNWKEFAKALRHEVVVRRKEEMNTSIYSGKCGELGAAILVLESLARAIEVGSCEQ